MLEINEYYGGIKMQRRDGEMLFFESGKRDRMATRGIK